MKTKDCDLYTWPDTPFSNPLLLSGEMLPSMPAILSEFPATLGALPDPLSDWRKLLNPASWDTQWLQERWERLYESLTPQEWQLHEAARKNQVIQIYRLIRDKGVSVDVLLEDGRTPLMSAISAQQANAALSLLRLGAKPDRMDYAGMNALLLHCSLYAADGDRSGHEALTLALLEAGRRLPNGLEPLLAATTPRLETPVLLLAKAGHAQSLKAMLCAADALQRPMLVKHADQDGMTPLMYAAWNNHADLAEFLVLSLPGEKRADYITQRNRWGRNALDIAGHWREKSALAVLNYHNKG